MSPVIPVVVVMIVRRMSSVSVVVMVMAVVIIPVRAVNFFSVVNGPDYGWLAVDPAGAWSVRCLGRLGLLGSLGPADDGVLLVRPSETGRVEDHVGRILDFGSWLVCVDGGSEAVLVGYVFDDTLSSVFDRECVGAHHSAGSVPGLLPGAGPVLSLSYVIERVWSIAVDVW